MAVTLKRKRGAVSYRELSSDDDLSASDGNTTARGRNKSGPSRRSARNRNVDDEDDDSGAASLSDVAPIEHRSHASRTSRVRGRTKVSYKDVSSDDEDPDAGFEFQEQHVMAVRTRPRAMTAQSSQSQQGTSRKVASRRRNIIGAPLKPNVVKQSEQKAVAVIPTDAHRPVSAVSTTIFDCIC